MYQSVIDRINQMIYTDGGVPQICAQPYLQALAEGDITGHSPWQAKGYNPDLSNAYEDLWPVGGTYVYPAAAQQMEVISSNANDASNGTGARTIRIYYLTETFEEKTTDVTLNGTNVVATTATDIYRINDVVVTSAGSGGVAAGNIDVRNLADTPIYSRILAGQTIDRDLIYTVPIGKTLYITSGVFSCASSVSGRPVTFVIRAKYNYLAKTSSAIFIGYMEATLQDNALNIPFELPIAFPAGTDVKISAISSQGATYGSVQLYGWLE